MRLAESHPVLQPGDICVFEQSHRPGGRIVSISNMGVYDDLVVDAGAYQYWSGRDDRPMNEYLISQKYGLPSIRYDQNDPELRVIVDTNGRRAGFDTFVKNMVAHAELDNMAKFYYNHKFVSMDFNDGGSAKILQLKIRFPYITFMGIRGSPNPIICTYLCFR